MYLSKILYKYKKSHFVKSPIDDVNRWPGQGTGSPKSFPGRKQPVFEAPGETDGILHWVHLALGLLETFGQMFAGILDFGRCVSIGVLGHIGEFLAHLRAVGKPAARFEQKTAQYHSASASSACRLSRKSSKAATVISRSASTIGSERLIMPRRAW